MKIFHLPGDPGRNNDFPTIPALLDAMTRAMSQGATVWVKWTCPACGERAGSDEPNMFCGLDPEGTAGDYVHTEKADGTPCGGVYRGTRFGFAMVMPVPSATHPVHKAGGN